MGEKQFLTPAEILQVTIQNAEKKVALPIYKMLLLGIMAGAFIAFAGEASNMAAYSLLASPDTYGLGRVMAGAVFAGGLVMVVIAGGELFTGNCLMAAGIYEKKVTLAAVLKNWLFVYIGNFIGGCLVSWCLSYSGLLESGAGLLGAVTVKIAAGKVVLPFGKALVMGILCNWLVALGVWMGTAAKDAAGKVLSMFFPIWIFVISGFEHCIANMFYVPTGIFAKAAFAEKAIAIGASPEAVEALNWTNFAITNLIPVTIGNVIGGAVCVAFVYWLVYRKKEK